MVQKVIFSSGKSDQNDLEMSKTITTDLNSFEPIEGQGIHL